MEVGAVELLAAGRRAHGAQRAARREGAETDAADADAEPVAGHAATPWPTRRSAVMLGGSSFGSSDVALDARP